MMTPYVCMYVMHESDFCRSFIFDYFIAIIFYCFLVITVPVTDNHPVVVGNTQRPHSSRLKHTMTLPSNGEEHSLTVGGGKR